MPDSYYYAGGRRIPLERSEELVSVRFRDPDRIRRGMAPESLARRLRAYPVVEERPDLRLSVLRAPRARGLAAAMADIGADPAVELVTPVYHHEGSSERLLVTDLFVCQFKPEVQPAEQAELHRMHRVRVVEVLDFAPAAFVLQVDARSGGNAVETANRYHESGRVLFAHADFAKPRQLKALRPSRAKATARAERQWHLDNTGQSGGQSGCDARVHTAWQSSRGNPDVTIAVIDDGFDIAHPDFGPLARIRHPRDIRSGTDDPRPRELLENHGTCVLGVAVAGGRGSGLYGVAPECSLMPIRLSGSERDEAKAIAGAAANGAAVINCSWGPPDGAWWDPRDPLHRREHPLPDVVAAAMRYALSTGRAGRGSVLVWAAGNGNESIANDGYASSPYVIAVGAVNHRDRHAVYSDHGPGIALVAPSSDIGSDGATVGGIWTSDRRGAAGYNPGAAWTDAFGGTSSAAPVVAGVAALVLSVHPDLTRDEVLGVLIESAARCDPGSRTWKKRGSRLTSDWYGAGRVDAAAAVARAAMLRKPAGRRR